MIAEMNPVLLQKQLRDNAADLNDFYNDVKIWGEDMKRKESNNTCSDRTSRVSKKKRHISSTKKTSTESKVKPKSRMGYTDYSAWDKFDAEAECKNIDYNENEDSELTDECDESARDEAYVEKERGNKYVKDKKWDEAIQCYNKAIDFYSYDPIFYANRALCFLKQENFVKAELDCTMSIKLDATYVKAYQRRAAAREVLGELEQAESDLLKVLELEPKNKESLSNLDVLRKNLKAHKPSESLRRPVSKFTASRNKKGDQVTELSYKNNDTYNTCKATNEVNSGKVDYLCGDTDRLITVKAIVKPVHLQSKKPLKQVDIQEANETEAVINEQHQSESFPRPSDLIKTFKTDDLKIIERPLQHHSVNEIIKENKNNENSINITEIQVKLCAPKNSVQFYAQWRQLKGLDNKYDYLKLIRPEDLPVIFKECLETSVFSNLLEVLVKCFIKNNDEVFSFLMVFCQMRRFSTIMLFMTATDKNHLRQLFDYERQRRDHPKEQIDLVLKKYELEN